MDNRKQQVLTAIVRLYSIDGEPVGSTVLAKHLSLTVSSATLRSEMAALTKLGLLVQPHTSAGRIPSAKGYRYYIDNLLDTDVSLHKSEKDAIDAYLNDMDLNPEHLASNFAKALSRLYNLATIVLTPENVHTCASHFEAVQVGRFTVAVLCVTDVGGVSTRTVKLQAPLQKGDIQILNYVLNKYFVFTSPADITTILMQSAIQVMGERTTALVPCIDAAHKLIKGAGKANLYCVGHHHLLKNSDFSSDIDILNNSLRNLMAFMADERAVRLYLSNASPITNILLGEDINEYPMPGYCIINKQYIAGGGRTGSIAIIGSSRMQFKTIIPKLEYFANKLSECMSGNTKGGM